MLETNASPTAECSSLATDAIRQKQMDRQPTVPMLLDTTDGQQLHHWRGSRTVSAQSAHRHTFSAQLVVSWHTISVQVAPSTFQRLVKEAERDTESADFWRAVCGVVEHLWRCCHRRRIHV
jgi:hypothetical protein